MSRLGEYFRRRRSERGLGLGDLAGLLGYRNRSKGANRIRAFEGGGKVHPALLGNLSNVLGVGPDEIRRLVDEDYQDWLAWANEPIRPYVVVWLMACVYQRVQLPDDALDPEMAEAFAADVARQKNLRAWLVLSRRVSVEFDEAGNRRGRLEATPEMPCEPSAVFGRNRVQFDFDGGVAVRPIVRPPK